jgi:hypothetical protein
MPITNRKIDAGPRAEAAKTADAHERKRAVVLSGRL